MTATLTATGDCPKCEQGDFAAPSDLAAHLIDQHNCSGVEALRIARPRDAHVPTKEESSMARQSDRAGECPECHRFRHKQGCSQYVGAGRHKPSAPPAAVKRKPIMRGHPKPPRKAAATNSLVSEIAALGAVAEALTALDSTGRANVLGCICKLLAIDPSKLAA